MLSDDVVPKCFPRKVLNKCSHQEENALATEAGSDVEAAVAPLVCMRALHPLPVETTSKG
jgi:hypothetical protein